MLGCRSRAHRRKMARIGVWLDLFVFSSLFCAAKQACVPEVSYNGIPVLWPASPDGTVAESEPQCFGADGIEISRYCNGTEWVPPLPDVTACMTVVEQFDSDGCPPGYSPLSENSTAYCYQIAKPAAWNYPCLRSGGASVVTDLNDADFVSLVESLKPGRHRNFWLPGRRLKAFNPVAWSIPGQNWGVLVKGSRNLPYHESIFSNCLLLDVENMRMSPGACDRRLPALCLYVNEASFPARCPEGYHAFRFMPDKDSCYGIEHSTAILGNTYNDFMSGSCPIPMGGSYSGNLERFIFMKLAEVTRLSDNLWCWFHSSYFYNGTHVTQKEGSVTNSSIATEVNIASLQGMINSLGTLGLMNVQSRLPCMACEKYVDYEDTELSFEYNNVDHTMYLTVYYPLGLWKDQKTDKGMQCFSDANGFVRVVDIADSPYIEANHRNQIIIDDDLTEEVISKVVYKIDPVTDRSAQYWCEGHSKNFTFLQTNKIVVNPRGEEEHVYALVIKTGTAFSHGNEYSDCYLNQLTNNITIVLDAKQVLLMEFLDVSDECMMVLFHVHVYLGESDDDTSSVSDLIVNTYHKLVGKALKGFPEYQITFVNMTSSTRCLPTTSEDIFTLDWELTAVGQITAPKQFCLQENGLPVKRRCGGSYSLGAVWRDVDGKCSERYSASNTTTFLYNVAKGQVSHNSTAHFLTKGLSAVLDDLDIIIPADIYYLSMSFQFILQIADYNDTWIDLGDIYNIAWIMNQVMILDWDYLRLAQTLNSTSVIVDSISNIIEIIATTNNTFIDEDGETRSNPYELAVEPAFVVQVTYPSFNNMTGLAMIKNTKSKNFKDMTILPLHKNTTLQDVLDLENIEVAAWVPDTVLKTLRVNNNESESALQNNETVSDEDVHIIVNIFSNDAVFQEIEYAPHDVKGRIIGIAIPGYISNLQYPITIIFKQKIRQDAEKACGYWNFNANVRGSAPGYWASDGCFLAGYVKNLTICKCFHLTHFGQLISRERRNEGNSTRNSPHDKALNVITLVGCFLSLLGIAGIWITAILFHSWRQKPGTKVLLQLSAAIAIPLILMLFFNLDLGLFEVQDEYYLIAENKRAACIALGAILHFSILSGFTWMLITAILQFIRYVRVLGVHRPTRFMFKLALVGWGAPLVPVLITLIVDRNCYVPPPVLSELVTVSPICYPNGVFFYFSIILPVASVLIVNVVLFVLVLYSISRGPDGKFRDADMDLICAQLRLSVFLFFLLGLTWIFGIFSFSEKGQLLSYLFCLTSTLQGFVLFVYFVVCDPATRLLWISLMKPQFRTSASSLTSVNN